MLALIVAHTRNRVIGRDGRLPWSIPGDLHRFRDLTMGNAVIMGRVTYEEIGHPLPGRLNIVVSRTQRYEGENLCTAASLAEAIALAGDRHAYVSGGARLFAEALPLVDVMYITEIDADVDGDVFFPEFDASAFDRRVEARFEGELPYEYVTYTRRRDAR